MVCCRHPVEFLLSRNEAKLLRTRAPTLLDSWHMVTERMESLAVRMDLETIVASCSVACQTAVGRQGKPRSAEANMTSEASDTAAVVAPWWQSSSWSEYAFFKSPSQGRRKARCPPESSTHARAKVLQYQICGLWMIHHGLGSVVVWLVVVSSLESL